jgi:hypothetical protein
MCGTLRKKVCLLHVGLSSRSDAWREEHRGQSIRGLLPPNLLQ